MEISGRFYERDQFERYFRRVYQHFGSREGYELLPDVLPFLDFMKDNHPNIVLGITTNTPTRTIDTVIPLMGIHDRFRFFVCCQEVNAQ